MKRFINEKITVCIKCRSLFKNKNKDNFYICPICRGVSVSFLPKGEEKQIDLKGII
jgi:rRNA maturation endonuclease Nob1